MNTTFDQHVVTRANNVLEIAVRMNDKQPGKHDWTIDDIVIDYQGYAEPGYSSKTGVIARGDWNSPLAKRVFNIFEKLGIECEWSDEWSDCSCCGKLVRTSPDSYSWKASFAIIDGCEVWCHECIKDDPEQYLESIECDYRKACTINIDLTDYGYRRFNDERYESGWHEGQTDSPKDVAAEIEAAGFARYLFRIEGVGQFDTHWSAWVKDEPTDDD